MHNITGSILKTRDGLASKDPLHTKNRIPKSNSKAGSGVQRPRDTRHGYEGTCVCLYYSVKIMAA